MQSPAEMAVEQCEEAVGYLFGAGAAQRHGLPVVEVRRFGNEDEEQRLDRFAARGEGVAAELHAQEVEQPRQAAPRLVVGLDAGGPLHHFGDRSPEQEGLSGQKVEGEAEHPEAESRRERYDTDQARGGEAEHPSLAEVIPAAVDLDLRRPARAERDAQPDERVADGASAGKERLECGALLHERAVGHRNRVVVCSEGVPLHGRMAGRRCPVFGKDSVFGVKQANK